MKKIKYIMLMLIVGIFMPAVVNASSGTIKVTGSSTVVQGNNVTVTVTLSGSKIGSWQMDLNYDRSYLRLVETTSESAGTYMVGSSSTANGIKSKQYTFKFKTLKKGSTKVSVSSYIAYDMDENEINLTSTSKTIKIITQEELEASYSSNANLGSLKVEGYTLNPAFNANTTEYSLEVENDVESVNVSASVADKTADLSGTGTINLSEGSNKVEIKVTAQKGNIKTYTLTIYRKELNPISETIDGKTYGIVRKDDIFPTYNGFNKIEIDYKGETIPALNNEITGKTLLIMKDEAGDIKAIEYKDGDLGNFYIELKGNQIIVEPLELPKKMDDIYEKIQIDFNDMKVDAYALNKDSKVAIIYAQDTTTGDINYYQVDLISNAISIYDDEIITHYEKTLEKYKYVFLGMLGIIILLILVVIFKKPKKIKQSKIEETNDNKNNKD